MRILSESENEDLRARAAGLAVEALSVMRQGIVVCDGDGVCVLSNHRLRHLLELPGDWRGEGRTLADLVREFAARGDYGPRIPKATEITDDMPFRPGFEEIYHETPLGRIVSVTVAPRVDEAGWVVTFNDTTELKEHSRNLGFARKKLAVSEERMRKLAGQAEAANRAKSSFLASMSHEIRTPMNGIIGMAELLSETELSLDQRVYADTIQQSAEALLVIINDILDFSKIEAGKLDFEFIPFNLMTTTEDVLMLVSPKARERQVELILDYDPEMPMGFNGDAVRIRQILLNLVGNAVKFTSDGQVVVAVRATQEADRHIVNIGVTDTGIGIPEDKLDKIFGQFDQVDQTTSRKFGGTGLGLAITKSLVEMMGGTVSVSSVLGQGSRFTVRVPLPTEPQIDRVVDAPDPGLNGKRVLIVDGLLVNRRCLSDRLGAAGIEAIAVPDGAAAEARLQELLADNRRPDAVLIDRTLPDGDAATIAPRLSAAIPGVPLILSTTIDPANEMSAEDRAQFKTTLFKPLRNSLLMRGLADVMVQEKSVKAHPGAEQAIAEVEDAEPTTVTLDILVAEDNRTNQLVLKKMLKTADVTLRFANNGREAVDMFEDCVPDLVLMDISMPEMDGFEATAAIREIEGARGLPRTTVVALTANAMSGDREKCLSLGMDDYLSKPVRKQSLTEMLRKHCPQDL